MLKVPWLAPAALAGLLAWPEAARANRVRRLEPLGGDDDRAGPTSPSALLEATVPTKRAAALAAAAAAAPSLVASGADAAFAPMASPRNTVRRSSAHATVMPKWAEQPYETGGERTPPEEQRSREKRADHKGEVFGNGFSMHTSDYSHDEFQSRKRRPPQEGANWDEYHVFPGGGARKKGERRKDNFKRGTTGPEVQGNDDGWDIRDSSSEWRTGSQGDRPRQAEKGHVYHTVGPTSFDESLAKTPEESKEKTSADTSMEEIPARNMLSNPMSGTPWSKVSLPKEWVWKFTPGSVEYFPSGEEGSNPKMYGLARTKTGVTDLEVKFGSWKSDDPKTQRHVRISEMLSNTGTVPHIHEVKKTPETTFLLTDSPGAYTLASLLEEWEQERVVKQQGYMGSLVPIDVALPLMIDMLRGLEVMEGLGIVMSDLNEHQIYIVDKQHQQYHTMFDDFRGSCVLGEESDEEVTCDLVDLDLDSGSAFRHAPEMASGLHMVQSNVWQLGMVFAKLFIGHVVPDAVKAKFDDTSAEGKWYIRDFMHKRFSIWDNPHFRALYEDNWDILGIVAGMLEKDPMHRWTTQQALREAVAVAKRRGIRTDPWWEPETDQDEFHYRGWDDIQDVLNEMREEMDRGSFREHAKRDVHRDDFRHREKMYQDDIHGAVREGMYQDDIRYGAKRDVWYDDDFPHHAFKQTNKNDMHSDDFRHHPHDDRFHDEFRHGAGEDRYRDDPRGHVSSDDRYRKGRRDFGDAFRV